MRRLFVFRPEPASRQTVVKAQALGLDAVSIPLFELHKLEWSPPEAGDYDALLLTSANTVKMAGDRLDIYRALPVHAVRFGAVAMLGLKSRTAAPRGPEALHHWAMTRFARPASPRPQPLP